MTFQKRKKKSRKKIGTILVEVFLAYPQKRIHTLPDILKRYFEYLMKRVCFIWAKKVDHLSTSGCDVRPCLNKNFPQLHRKKVLNSNSNYYNFQLNQIL